MGLRVPLPVVSASRSRIAALHRALQLATPTLSLESPAAHEPDSSYEQPLETSQLGAPPPGVTRNRRASRSKKGGPQGPPFVHAGRLRALLGDHPYDKQHYDGADHRADPARRLTRSVPTQRLAEEPGHNRADNAQDGSHDDAHVLVAGHDGAGDQPHDKADDDHNDDAHTRAPLPSVGVNLGMIPIAGAPAL